jgi:hypothetical protein
MAPEIEPERGASYGDERSEDGYSKILGVLN